MSFEDNMIDDGFTDEMDYMDYLMAKANDMDDYDYSNDDEDVDEDDDEDDDIF